MCDVAGESGAGGCLLVPYYVPCIGLGFAPKRQPLYSAVYDKQPHFFCEWKMGRVAIGVDGYNQSISGDVAMTVTCAASDCHHVPLVIEWFCKSPRRLPLLLSGHKLEEMDAHGNIQRQFL